MELVAAQAGVPPPVRRHCRVGRRDWIPRASIPEWHVTQNCPVFSTCRPLCSRWQVMHRCAGISSCSSEYLG